ncbi:MAG: YihA family ribosome biogenesis GTP-binding protein [Bacteroidia bacterium]
MPLEFKKAKFIRSYGSVEQIKNSGRAEFAFIGRSNVGKSSLINALCSNKNLAKTSSVPGKTQLINFFEVEEKIYLVDLPGYGYAKVSKKLREQFEGIISEYLIKSQNLYVVFVLVDASIPPQKIDLDFINWCGKFKVPIAVVFTKTDKKKGKQVESNISKFEQALSLSWEEIPVEFFTSSTKKEGLEEIQQWIVESLEHA